MTRTHGLQGHASDASPHEALHLHAYPVKHLPDLALDTLPEHDLCKRRRDQADALHPGPTAFNHEPLEQLRNRIGLQRLVEGHQIFFVDLAGGMGELLGKNSIIGQQEQALAVTVQSSDVVEASQVRWQQIVESLSTSFVRARAEKTFRLVECDDGRRRGRLCSFAPNPHVVPIGNRRRQLANEVTVNRDLAIQYQLFAGTARAEARGCKESVQSHRKWLPESSGKKKRACGKRSPEGLFLRFGLWQTDDPLIGFELAALLHQLNALEALEDTASGLDGAFAFKAGMLTHSRWIIPESVPESKRKCVICTIWFVYFLVMPLNPRAFLAAVASLSCAALTFAELPPSAYEAKQKAAPERLKIEVMRVDVEPGDQPGQQRVVAAALVSEVTRTASELVPGQLIDIVYTITERPRGFSGPGEVPLLSERDVTVAYLARSAETAVYAPAAGVMSFRDF